MKIADQLISVTLICLVLLHPRVYAEEVKIAVAANFINANREIVSLFERSTGHTARVSYGSTGKLYSQIEHGAPFELFMAADTARPIRAEEAGLAVPGTRFVYARGRIVLWSIKPGLFNDGQHYLEGGEVERLALANPRTAPYGLAAQQVMQRLGVAEKLSPKLVRGESIAQAFQFVATGNAQAGFVALAQIKDWKGEAGTLWEIPPDYYAPIDQAAVLLNRGESNPAAKDYLAFLRSDVAREVIARYGYGVE